MSVLGGIQLVLVLFCPGNSELELWYICGPADLSPRGRGWAGLLCPECVRHWLWVTSAVGVNKFLGIL